MEYNSAVKGNNILIHAARWMNHRSILFGDMYQIHRFHSCEIPRTGNHIVSRVEERGD